MTLAQSQPQPPNDIGTLAFDFDVARQTSAIASPDRMLVAIRQELLTTIDQCIDFAGLGAENVQIPEITLDLGAFDDPPDWDAVRQRVQDDLLSALAPYLKHRELALDTAARMDPAPPTAQTMTLKTLRMRLTGQPTPTAQALQAAITNLSDQDVREMARRMKTAGLQLGLPDEIAALRTAIINQIEPPGDKPTTRQADVAQIRLTLTGEQAPAHALLLTALHGLSTTDLGSIIARLGIQDKVAKLQNSAIIAKAAQVLMSDTTGDHDLEGLLNERIRDILTQSMFTGVDENQQSLTPDDVTSLTTAHETFHSLSSCLIDASEVESLLQQNLPADATHLKSAITKLTEATYPDAAKRAALAALLQRIQVDIAAVREATPTARNTPALTLARLFVAMGESPRKAAQRVADLIPQRHFKGTTRDANQRSQGPSLPSQTPSLSDPKLSTGYSTDTTPFSLGRVAQTNGAATGPSNTLTDGLGTARQSRQNKADNNHDATVTPALKEIPSFKHNKQTTDSTNEIHPGEGVGATESHATKTPVNDTEDTKLEHMPTSGVPSDEATANNEKIGANESVTGESLLPDHQQTAAGMPPVKTDAPDVFGRQDASQAAPDAAQNAQSTPNKAASQHDRDVTKPTAQHAADLPPQADHAQSIPNGTDETVSDTGSTSGADEDVEFLGQQTHSEDTTPAPKGDLPTKTKKDGADKHALGLSGSKPTDPTSPRTAAQQQSESSSEKTVPVTAKIQTIPGQPRRRSTEGPSEETTSNNAPKRAAPQQSTRQRAEEKSDKTEQSKLRQIANPDPPVQDLTDNNAAENDTAKPAPKTGPNQPSSNPQEASIPDTREQLASPEHTPQSKPTVAETEALLDTLFAGMLPSAQADTKETLRLLAAVLGDDTASGGPDKTTFWAAALHAASTVASDAPTSNNVLATTFANNLLETRQDRTLALRNAIARLNYKSTGPGAEQQQAKAILEAMLTPADITLPTQPKPEPNMRYDTQTAGLILFHPYIAMLFERLEIGRDRKGILPEVRGLARSALDHLAYGDALPDMPADTLQKCLLGLPPDAPSPTRASLDRAATDLIDGLIQSVISQWGKLGNTSADGLRAAFVQRGGVLQFEGAERHVLTVNTGPYDMLLDALPWPFNMVTLPWMPAPLMVDWREQDD